MCKIGGKLGENWVDFCVICATIQIVINQNSMKRNNVWGIVLAIIITAIVAGGGVYVWQNNQLNEKIESPKEPIANEVKEDPISYSTKGVATVSKDTETFDWTAESLENMARECETEYAEGYFKTVVGTYDDTSMVVYNFEYNGESQRPDTWGVKLLPNLMNYSSLEEFQNDFGVCAVGGLYPTRMNKDWLLFESSCDSGYDDGSGLPHGCDEVKDVVKPTIEFN